MKMRRYSLWSCMQNNTQIYIQKPKQASKMKLFVKIVAAWKPSIFAKSFILDVITPS